jgi:hypothetical protein
MIDNILLRTVYLTCAVGHLPADLFALERDPGAPALAARARVRHLQRGEGKVAPVHRTARLRLLEGVCGCVDVGVGICGSRVLSASFALVNLQTGARSVPQDVEGAGEGMRELHLAGWSLRPVLSRCTSSGATGVP